MRAISIIGIIAIGLLFHSAPHAQTPNPDQQLRTDLFDKMKSGKRGSLEVADIFAGCHGFQSALYEHLNKDVIIRLDDMEFARTISRQSIEAGHMAFMAAVKHVGAPEIYIKDASKTVKARSARELAASEDMSPYVKERLSECFKIAPMAVYYRQHSEKRQAKTKR